MDNFSDFFVAAYSSLIGDLLFIISQVDMRCLDLEF